MSVVIELLLLFLKIGLFTFGGGYAMISIIENNCVEKKKWITHEEMMDITVIAESTPGPIVINCATFVGYKMSGVLGAVAATLGVVFPSFCVILLVTVILKNFTDNKYFKAVIQGLKPCIIGIILATGLHLVVTNCVKIEENFSMDIQALSILLILLGILLGYKKIRKRNLSPIMLIIVSAIVGIGVGAIVG